MSRNGVLEHIEQLLGAAEDGSGGLAVLRGPAGTGKTALTAEIEARARARGFDVNVGAGSSPTAARPFGAVLDALSGARSAIDLPTPDPRSPTGLADFAMRVTDDVIHEVERRSELGPVLIAIDDLQGCDGGALRALRTLALRAPALRVAIIVTELDEAGAPGLLDHVADAVIHLESTARAPGGVPPDVTARLDELPADARRAVRASAILGSRASLASIAALAGEPLDAVTGALAAAERVGLVVDGDDAVWDGDEGRLAILDAIPVVVRRSIHDDAAAALVRAGASPHEVATHLVAGHGLTTTDPVGWLRRAARESWTADPESACTFLRRAVDLAGPLAPERDELLLELVSPLTWSGRAAEAEAAAREVLARARDPERRREARIELAMSLQHNGRVPEAAALWDRGGVAAIESDPDRAGLLLGTFGYNALLLGDVGGLRARAGQALEQGDALGHDGLRSVGEMLEGLADLTEWRAADAVARGERSLELAGDRWLAAPATSLVVSLARIELDDLDAAREAIDVGRDLAETLRSSTYTPALHWNGVGHAFLAGLWDDALLGVEAGIELVDEMGLPTGRALALAVRAVILHHRGDPAGALEAVEAAERSVIEHGAQLGLDWALWARALLLEESGNHDVALAVLRNAWLATQSIRGMVTSRAFAPDLVRLAVVAGDRALADDVSAQVDVGAARNPSPSLVSTARRLRGLIDGSTAILREAAELAAANPRPLDRAATRGDAALALAADGDSEAAGALAEAALADYAQLGAQRAADALVAQLRPYGVHRASSRGSGERASEGWDSLTEAEHKVAMLVASGLTNREVAARLYISRHTVDSHLRRVYTKLGVTSRVALAVAAQESA